MASAFSHALAAASIGSIVPHKGLGWRFWLIGILCAVLPDADVISFSLGIPYDHLLGHRGLTHSLLFAVVWSWLMVEIFCRFAERFSRSWWILWGYFAICTASHALLDAITNGGLGVAFFAPFENSRYFMPWRPVQVAPIGAANFFSEWGIRVIKSELIFIGIPCLVISAGGWLWRRVSSTK